MVFKEIETRRINRKLLENYMDGYCSDINIYGKCDNLIFMMIGQNTGVYDIDNNKFIISSINGIAYPVSDKNNNKYIMVITSKYGDKIYCRDYNQPKYSDTAISYMYDMEEDFHNLECFCNVFDMNGQNVVPKDRYLANIYQFNNMLEGDRFEKTIKYRDLLDEEICLDNKKYVSYDDLPIALDNDYVRIYNAYAIETFFKKNNVSKKEDSFSLNVILKKNKYTVVDSDRNIMINYDDGVSSVKIVDDNTIVLRNINGNSAIYDINKGYLITFDDGISFDKVSRLDNDILKVDFSSKSCFLINNNLSKEVYDDIYMTSDKMIVCEKIKKVDFYNIDGALLFSINAKNFYKYDEYLFYSEDYKYYCYNFNTGIKKEMDVLSLFKLEDGTDINLGIDEVLDNYSYYFDGEFSERECFTLFNDKKYGVKLKIEVGTGKYVDGNRWFNQKDERDLFFLTLLNSFLDMSLDMKKDSSLKRVKKIK